MRGQRIVALVVCGVVLALLVGCEEQLTSETSNAKKSRVIAAENMELKKTVAQLDKELKTQRQQCEKKIQQKEEQLANCLAQKKTLEGDVNEKCEEVVNLFLQSMNEEITRLKQENESLKAEVTRLKAQGKEAQGVTEGGTGGQEKEKEQGEGSTEAAEPKEQKQE